MTHMVHNPEAIKEKTDKINYIQIKIFLYGRKGERERKKNIICKISDKA